MRRDVSLTTAPPAELDGEPTFDSVVDSGDTGTYK